MVVAVGTEAAATRSLVVVHEPEMGCRARP